MVFLRLRKNLTQLPKLTRTALRLDGFVLGLSLARATFVLVRVLKCPPRPCHRGDSPLAYVRCRRGYLHRFDV